MKGWIAVAAGGFGLAAFLRRRRRKGEAELEPADELRARLAQAKAEPPAAETVVVPAVEVAPEPERGHEPDALDDRRRGVHDAARAALDELR